MQLTQKETGLLKDLKDQEQLCIDKYRKHAESAHDSGLSGLLNYIGGVESEHLRVINEISAGGTPTLAAAGTAPAVEAANTDVPRAKSAMLLSAPTFLRPKSTPRTFTTPAFLSSGSRNTAVF